MPSLTFVSCWCAVDARIRQWENARRRQQRLERNELRSKITARKDAAIWRLVDLAVRQPVLDSEIVQRELAVAPHNGNTAIETLEGVGALKKAAGNYRNRKWAASEVLAALDRFAERAGRRQRHGRYER